MFTVIKCFLLDPFVLGAAEREPITALHLSLAAAQDAWPSRDAERDGGMGG